MIQPEIFKVRTEITYTIEYHEFDKFINQQYGSTDYSFAAATEAHNDEKLDFYVNKKFLDKWELESLGNFKKHENKYDPHPLVLLIGLCNRDIIETGHYLVNVSW